MWMRCSLQMLHSAGTVGCIAMASTSSIFALLQLLLLHSMYVQLCGSCSAGCSSCIALACAQLAAAAADLPGPQESCGATGCSTCQGCYCCCCSSRVWLCPLILYSCKGMSCVCRCQDGSVTCVTDHLFFPIIYVEDTKLT